MSIPKINYDFGGLVDAFEKMLNMGLPTPGILRTIKSELNKFFKDSKCEEVIYTTNNDRMFFGVKIIAMISPDYIYDYLIDDEPTRIGKYIIEFDSKLFDPVLGLTVGELLAITLHEVGHMVGDSEPIENARRALDAYLAVNKDRISISHSIHYKEILAYGLKDYLSKSQSMFYTSDASEIYADEFAASYGFSEDLTSAYDKIVRNNMKLYENSQVSKFITFGWTLALYKNLKVRRVGALRTLARAQKLTGSRLEKMEIENVIKRIKRIDDDDLIQESASDVIRLKVKEKMRKARLNNLRTLDNTYYELSMQIKNVEDENDALWLMRQLNTSISVIGEYANSADLDDYERDMWVKALDRFTKLREKLVSSVVYKNKTYGIFVNYPDIVENRY